MAPSFSGPSILINTELPDSWTAWPWR